MSIAGAKRTAGVSSSRRPRGRPPASKGADTRAAILSISIRLFGTRGYNGVSMEALAAECGMNARALYYYFPSKRELFDATAAEATSRFSAAVVERVFSVSSFSDRVHGYIDVYRSLYSSDPDLLPFIGNMLVESLAEDPTSPQAARSESGVLLRRFGETVVDEAFARGELEPGVDREGAIKLLAAMGTALSLASIDGADYLAMLDVLERLNDGTLYSPPESTSS